jgi:hypothetical protein
MSSRVPESHCHVIARRRQAPVRAIGKTAHWPCVPAQIPDHTSRTSESSASFGPDISSIRGCSAPCRTTTLPRSFVGGDDGTVATG